MAVPDSRDTYRFREFDLDIAAYELRRDGRPIRLERQPMDLLILLVARRGQLVPRSEIVNALWGKDVFVDVETGVNTAIRKIRQALRDSTEAPSFIETVPGKGYRFVAPVELLPHLPQTPAAPVTAPPASADPSIVTVAEPAASPIATGAHETAHRDGDAQRRRMRSRVVLGVLALAALGGVIAWGWNRTVDPGSRVIIAVLPFENLSRNGDTDYLADGLAEDTIVSLGRIDPSRVSVIGRTSMMAYKGTKKSLAEIGRELGAHYLVESSFRAETTRLRVTSRLIRARDQIQVWSDSFDRDAGSILSMQQELSWAIAQQVQTRLSPDRQRALARQQTQNAEAYDLFLRGRNFATQRTPETTRRAIESFQRATALDPDYALAWSGLAMAYAASPMNGDAAPLDVWPSAREAAVRAVTVNGDLAEAQHALAYVNWMFEWKWEAAEAAFRRAIELDPSYSLAHVTLGHLLSQTGRHDQARGVMQRARELDPLSALPYALSSQVAFQGRDYRAALDHASRAIALGPEFWIGHQVSAQAHEQLGHDEAALHALSSAARLSGQNSKSLSLSGYILARAGRAAEARDLLIALETASRQRYVPPYATALVHAGLGDADAVFEWLERAYAARDVHLIFLPVDAKWDRYRSDPRFAALLARCGFAGATQTRDQLLDTGWVAHRRSEDAKNRK